MCRLRLLLNPTETVRLSVAVISPIKKKKKNSSVGKETKSRLKLREKWSRPSSFVRPDLVSPRSRPDIVPDFPTI